MEHLKEILRRNKSEGWGGGRYFMIPNGINKLSFSWGLGHATNNQAEFLTLFMGLILANWSKLNHWSFWETLKLSLKLSRSTMISQEGKKTSSHLRIFQELEIFSEVKFYHILRDNNKIVNELTY
jgi:hypothetical protein